MMRITTITPRAISAVPNEDAVEVTVTVGATDVPGGPCGYGND